MLLVLEGSDYGTPHRCVLIRYLETIRETYPITCGRARERDAAAGRRVVNEGGSISTSAKSPCSSSAVRARSIPRPSSMRTLTPTTPSGLTDYHRLRSVGTATKRSPESWTSTSQRWWRTSSPARFANAVSSAVTTVRRDAFAVAAISRSCAPRGLPWRRTSASSSACASATSRS